MKTHLAVALAIALMAAAPLAYPGPLQTHSGFGPLYTLTGDRAGTEVGIIPLALATLLTNLGASPVNALKGVELLAVAAGAAGMFVLARQLYGDDSALAAAALYSMLPYRLMTAYVRGAHGETLFMGLLPLVILAALYVRGGLRRRRLIRFDGYTVVWLVAGAVALWKACVPPQAGLAPVEAHFFQLFSPSWNYGGRGFWLDAVPLQLGIAPLGLSAIALALRPDRAARALGAGAAFCSALSVEPASGWWPWAVFLDAPWQLLAIAGLLLSLLGGSALAPDRRLRTLPLLAGAVTLAVLASYPYLEPRGLDYTPTRPALARFGQEAYLVDVESTALHPGTTVTLTLIWQGLRLFEEDYTVFVHLIDAQDKIWAQRDAPPLTGARPTRSWQPGELLRDAYVIAVPTDAPQALTIAIGLYDPKSGARLRTASGQDHLRLN